MRRTWVNEVKEEEMSKREQCGGGKERGRQLRRALRKH